MRLNDRIQGNTLAKHKLDTSVSGQAQREAFFFFLVGVNCQKVHGIGGISMKYAIWITGGVTVTYKTR